MVRTVLAALAAGLTLAAPASADDCKVEIDGLQANCHIFLVEGDAVPMTDWMGVTATEVLTWNRNLHDKLVDTDGDGLVDTFTGAQHVLISGPAVEEATLEPAPDYFANARMKCAQAGPHICGRIGWARTVEEFITSNYIPFELFARWNDLPEAVEPTTYLPEGALVVVYDPTDEQV